MVRARGFSRELFQVRRGGNCGLVVLQDGLGKGGGLCTMTMRMDAEKAETGRLATNIVTLRMLIEITYSIKFDVLGLRSRKSS